LTGLRRSPTIYRQKALAAVALIAVAAACVYYYVVDPSAGVAPRCMLRLLTGYDCPGCGSQRAFHAILHGRILDAWHYNPAVFFALPLAAAYLLIDLLPAPVARLLRSHTFIFAIAAAILAWWIARNL